mmetsp:Transcript_117977/g.328767  ORF Transcript_117977/g.328767 Transcript_117977/m.328767 type:complete len:231 (+) Transcript_117977:71-763(+)
MVELGVPSCLFGPEPDRSKPVQAYPGVSCTHFDPASQLAIYKEALQKEKVGLRSSERRYVDLQERRRRRGAGSSAAALGTLLEADADSLARAAVAAGHSGRSPAGSSLSALPPLRHSRSESALACQPPAALGPSSWLGANRPPGTPESALTVVTPDASLLSAAAPARAGPTPSELEASRQTFLAERRHENTLASRRSHFGLCGGFTSDYNRPPSVAPRWRAAVVPLARRP